MPPQMLLNIALGRGSIFHGKYKVVLEFPEGGVINQKTFDEESTDI